MQLDVRVQSGPALDALTVDPYVSATTVIVQSASNKAALVGGAFELEVRCTPCGVAGGTGGVSQSGIKLTVAGNPFPQASPSSMTLKGAFPGDLQCLWSLAPGSRWTRAFLPPLPTQIRVLSPPVQAELAVTGLPTAADVIPRDGYHLGRGLAPGEQVTITTAAVPDDLDFVGSFANFTLYCRADTEGYVELHMVSNGGQVHYSAASRGPHSLVLTMPDVSAERPMKISCYWSVDEESDLLTLDTWVDSDSIYLVVVAAPTTLAVRALSDAYLGDSVTVLIDPSRTVRLPNTYLNIDTVCALSAPVRSMSVAATGVARL